MFYECASVINGLNINHLTVIFVFKRNYGYMD